MYLYLIRCLLESQVCISFQASYMEALPYLIFGVMAMISAMLMLFTPETLNKRLPDTVEEAEGIMPLAPSNNAGAPVQTP